MRNKPLRIGITGGIGSGKSTVAKIFELLGVPVYNADNRAKWLMAHDQDLKQAIIAEFGSEAYQSGELNRTYLAEKVFPDEVLLAKLNALVHPAVATDFDTWCKHQQVNYILKEAALLYETGSYKGLDATILVVSPEGLRLQRIRQRDPQRSAAQIKNIMARQMPVAEALTLADYVIKNDEEKLLIPQVLALHGQLQEKTGPLKEPV